MNIRRPLFLSALLLGFAFAPSAKAQELGIQVHGRHSSIQVRFGDRSPRDCAPARPIGYDTREWIPGHYETISEQVWIAGREERVWVEPAYAWQYDACGRARYGCVRAGFWKTVCTPGHFETCTRKVWVEGGWRVRHCRG